MSKFKVYADLNKEFKSVYGHYTATRGDFENLPCPMVAILFSDEQMQELVDDVNIYMNLQYSPADLELLHRYRTEPNAFVGMTEREKWRAESMSDDEFAFSESRAVHLGMKYYEDLEESDCKEIMDLYNRQKPRNV